MIILSIYILGIIAYIVTLCIGYHELDSGTEITLNELSYNILMGLFSWIAFIAALSIIYGDKTVFRKK